MRNRFTSACILVVTVLLLSLTNQAIAQSETLVVPNDKPQKVMSRTVLEAGRYYIIEAAGTFDDWGNTSYGVDAVWCFAEWRCGRQGEVWDQLRINGQGMTQIAGQRIAYNPQHIYRIYYLGQGRPVEFYLSDALGSPGDNKGAVTVKIFWTQYTYGSGNTGGGGTGGQSGGVCSDQRTLAIMDEWLARANPPYNLQRGYYLRYEAWGRLVGRTPTNTVTVNGRPDTRMSRCEWLWYYSASLRSTNLGTLREYVERRRRQ